MNSESQAVSNAQAQSAGEPRRATPVVQTAGVSKSFGMVTALYHVDLTIRAGEVLSVFGPNGSGKTTLLRILATLSQPDEGFVVINGFDVSKQPEAARSTTGFVAHASLLYGDLTVWENLRFHARMFGIEDVESRVGQVAERMNVTDRLGQKVRTLSHGYQKRVSFARALLHRPRLLLLDEPFTGLDRGTVRVLDRLLRDFAAVGGAVLLTTHSVELGVEVADRVAILASGRFAFESDAGNVTAAQFAEIYDQTTGIVA